MIYSYFNFVTVPIVMTDNLIRREECYPISSSANNCKRGDAIPSENWKRWKRERKMRTIFGIPLEMG